MDNSNNSFENYPEGQFFFSFFPVVDPDYYNFFPPIGDLAPPPIPNGDLAPSPIPNGDLAPPPIPNGDLAPPPIPNGDLAPLPIPIDDVNATDNNSTIGIEDTLIRTRIIRNRTNSQYRLCGVPGVCNPSAIPSCLNVTVGDCDECSSTASGFFVFIILILGLAVLVGNLLILFVTARLHKKRTVKSNDWFKASLAVSDVITGLLIIFVVLPNFAWTLNSTFIEINDGSSASRNSANTIAGGFFYLLSFTSSLYHLLLLGVMRLYAIKWPHRYRLQTSKTIYIGIGIVWGCAGLVASFPAWFPQNFSFDYYHVTFIYLPSLVLIHSSSFTPAIISFFVLVALPYTLMTLILISTALMVRFQMKSSLKKLGQTPAESNKVKFSKQEIVAFKTVSVMQIGFTITLVPLAVVVSLLYARNSTCETISTSYLICFYLSMTNSLVNVLVYSVREKKFRSTVRDIFRNFKFSVNLEGFTGSKSTATSKVKNSSTAQSSSV